MRQDIRDAYGEFARCGPACQFRGGVAVRLHLHGLSSYVADSFGHGCRHGRNEAAAVSNASKSAGAESDRVDARVDSVRPFSVAVSSPSAVSTTLVAPRRCASSASASRNAIYERVIGTIRRGCLDRMLILGRRHLEAVLVEYVEHYNAHRPHRSLDQLSPSALDTSPVLIGDVDLARLRRTDHLGGIIHEYRIAA